MLWLLLSVCGYLFSAGYEAFDSDHGDLDAPLRPLDPITCAGCLNVEAILKCIRLWRWKPGLEAARVLERPSDFLVAKISGQRRVWSRRRYSPHFEALKNYGILGELRFANHCIFYSSYFTVPKNSQCDRAIFNGKRVSTLFSRPAPVNLPMAKDILKRLSLMPPKKYIITGDFRHWFHQIRVKRALSMFFGVACAGLTYEWTTLPMGWSWSPFVAQSFAWVVLLQGLGFSRDILDDPQLPAFALLPCGFVTVYYDNFLFATSDEEEARRILRNLASNVRSFNVCLKELSVSCPSFSEVAPFREVIDASSFCSEVTCSGDAVRPSHNSDMNVTCNCIEEGFTYLGLLIRCGPNGVEWKIDPKKIALLPGNLPFLRTPRLCAMAMGKILASFLPSGHALGTSPHMMSCIDAIRSAAHCARESNWDSTTLQLSRSVVDELSCAWSNMIANPFRHVICGGFNSRLYVATDASDWGWGLVILDEGGKLVKQRREAWTLEQRKLHIFIREVMASSNGLEFADSCGLLSEKTMIVLITDNTAAAWAIRRGYTVNSVAQRYINKILRFYHRLDVVSVVSEDNCSDAPSRNKKVIASAVQKTMHSVIASLNGRRTGLISNEPKFNAEVRHGEVDMSDTLKPKFYEDDLSLLVEDPEHTTTANVLDTILDIDSGDADLDEHTSEAILGEGR